MNIAILFVVTVVALVAIGYAVRSIDRLKKGK